MLSIFGCFSYETFAVFRYSDSLAYFDIGNQNHHHQISYNYNILTQITDNLLGRNTSLTWELLQYGDWKTHTDYFKRVEQMLITLLKTHEYVMINIQAIRIEAHKQSLEIVWKYSKKWQRNVIWTKYDMARSCTGVLCLKG